METDKIKFNKMKKRGVKKHDDFQSTPYPINLKVKFPFYKDGSKLPKGSQMPSKPLFQSGGINTPLGKDSALERKYESVEHNITNERKLKFQSGGELKLSKNIIPKGVLHKNKNNIPKELGFGGKGIPVVYCNTDGNCEKTAEIESNELILTKDNSTQLDRLVQKHKNGGATLQDIGNFFKQQLMTNTHNNTKDFKHIKGGKIKV